MLLRKGPAHGAAVGCGDVLQAAFERLLISDHDLGRPDADLVQRLLRTLGHGVVASDGIHVRIEEFNTHRVFAAGHKDVHDIAAHRELPRDFRRSAAFVAHAGEPRDELVPVEGTAVLQHQAVRKEHLFGRQLLERAQHRRDHDRLFRSAQRCQRRDGLLQLRRGFCLITKRGALYVGEHLDVGIGKKGQVRCDPFRPAGGRCEDQTLSFPFFYEVSSQRGQPDLRQPRQVDQFSHSPAFSSCSVCD